MTSPDENTYVSPTSFTQVALNKPVDFGSLEKALHEALSDGESPLEVTVMSDNPPPYGPQNVATLTVAQVGRSFSLEEVKAVLESYDAPPVEEQQAPTDAPAEEPTFIRDPDLDATPTEESLPDDDNPPAEEPQAPSEEGAVEETPQPVQQTRSRKRK